ncbi:MAG: TrmH family RNA methyltransferase [Cyanobium sp.]
MASLSSQSHSGAARPDDADRCDVVISSRRNPLVGRLRQLHEARGRCEQGCLLLEGTHLLEEALQLGLKPELLLATPAWIGRHQPLLALLPASSQLRQAEPAVLEAAATTRSPDGVLAVLPTPRPQLPARGATFVLALDRIQDPGNLGTLLRTALAGGVEAAWICAGADPLQPKVLRASSGAALALPLERLEAGALPQRLSAARQRGLNVVAAVLPGPSWPDPIPYWQYDWRNPTVLVLGNEGAGLDAALRPLVNAALTIPHTPAVESLNVAVAAAPLLLERWRQAAGGGAVRAAATPAGNRPSTG